MVEVVDCLENWTAVDRVTVFLDELYSIVFDCGGAGPGIRSCRSYYLAHHSYDYMLTST